MSWQGSRAGQPQLGRAWCHILCAPSQGVLKSHCSIIPWADSEFPANQLPLPGKELFLQLDGQRWCGHHVGWSRSPAPINKWRSVPQQEAKPRELPAQNKPHLVDGEAQLGGCLSLLDGTTADGHRAKGPHPNDVCRGHRY
jgi:hypothetical protein